MIFHLLFLDIETVAEADIDLEGFEGTRLQDDEKTDDLSLLESGMVEFFKVLRKMINKNQIKSRLQL